MAEHETKKDFSIENLEYIRTVMGERLKILKSRKTGFENDTKISDDKRQKLIEENEFEQAQTIFIEAIAMYKISNSIINGREKL